ncbi:ROK family protein [Streptomyces sp. TRM68367]|uniref:ROK family transcriptional regulator n=1 Tax=Streptomyces sp. TRM68367 TaxID=2758415 RepID=UPI00165B3F3A|nr:ROK family protein [Streptomyces sp. TRM68367]MBC9727785.1 ROK family protein [Streptomyces sp. TRM68367]
MLSLMSPREGGPLARLRRGHEELVLELLRRHGPLSRAELGRRSELSRTTLYDIVTALLDNGAVVTSTPAPAERRRGRPVETLTLHPGAGQVIGLDFARRAVHVAAVNVAHELIGSATEPHDADLPWDDRVDLAERLIDSLAGGTLRLGALSGVGVGVVGPVGDMEAGDDSENAAGADAREGAGRPGNAGPAPADGAEGSRTDLALLLRKRFGVPVLVDNNARLAALAEATWDAAAGDQDVVYLRLSHGVGGGLVVGGALHRGAGGLSGEIGHITVEPDGRRCSCGKRGCLETVASVGAVLDTYGRADDLPALLADPAAAGVLDAVGRHVGTVLAAVCNAIGPGVVVLGGELAEAGAALLGPVEQALTAHLMPLSRHRVDLRRATLGETGGALGAIALVLHRSPLLTDYPATDPLKDTQRPPHRPPRQPWP